MPSSQSVNFQVGTHHVDDLGVLFARQFIQDVPHLVIAAALYRLIASKHFLDSRAQSFGTVNHEKILLVRGQTPIAQTGQQILHRSCVFGGAHLDA